VRDAKENREKKMAARNIGDGGMFFQVSLFQFSIFRELKRLMSVTLSPIYAHFSETLTGLATIRALRDEARFKQENEHRLETNQRANFCGMKL